MTNLTEEQKKLILRCFNIHLEVNVVSYILQIETKTVQNCYDKLNNCLLEISVGRLQFGNFWDLYKVL